MIQQLAYFKNSKLTSVMSIMIWHIPFIYLKSQ
jgi:hypothetical protein